MVLGTVAQKTEAVPSQKDSRTNKQQAAAKQLTPPPAEAQKIADGQTQINDEAGSGTLIFASSSRKDSQMPTPASTAIAQYRKTQIRTRPRPRVR